MKKRYAERTAFRLKEADDIMGGAEAWENADQTTVQCPAEACNGTKAYFYSVQIRSAVSPRVETVQAKTRLPAFTYVDGRMNR